MKLSTILSSIMALVGAMLMAFVFLGFVGAAPGEQCYTIPSYPYDVYCWWTHWQFNREFWLQQIILTFCSIGSLICSVLTNGQEMY